MKSYSSLKVNLPIFLFTTVLTFLLSNNSLAQGCCSGGGGNPITGSSSTGVLDKNQFEIQSNYQYSSTNVFLSGDRDTTQFFKDLTSNYLFLKTDYGVSDKLTLSLGMGYYLNKTITEFADAKGIERKIESSGIGDLVILPRYSVFNRSKGANRSELTFGAGMKIPLGSNADSTFTGYSKYLNFDGPTPKIDSLEIWQVAPPTVQVTTGSNDLILYGFYFSNFPHRNIRLFSNAMYIHKGWNSLGQKFGDYASVAVYSEITCLKKFGVMAQVRGEWTGKMRSHEEIDQLSLYSIDTASTGSYKLAFVPQLRYSLTCGINLFANTELPLYQYMRGTQVASRYQFLFGLSYRFRIGKDESAASSKEMDVTEFTTDNHLEEKFMVLGKCDMCKKRIESTLMGMAAVSFVNWNIETMVLTIRFDPKQTSLTTLKKKLAEIGHDSDEFKASDKVYEKLHACCKYDRNGF